MNNKRWIQASVAVFVVMFALEFLIHAVLLQESYQKTAALWRSETEMQSMMWMMWAGYVIFAPFFTYIYIRGYEPKKSGLEQGLRFGLYMGLALAPMQSLGWYTVLPIPGMLAFYWFLAGMVEFVALGATAGLVYNNKTNTKTSKNKK